MSFISLDFLYRFSNICKPWLVKKRQDGKTKLCWVIGALLTSIPVCLDKFTDWPLAYASSGGICFIEPQVFLIAFFIGPSLFLFSVSVVSFIVTISNICRLLPEDTDITAAADRNMALIFSKIGGLMGVTWLFALIPYITGVEEFWYVFTILNGMQGLFIFLSCGIFSYLIPRKKRRATANSQDSAKSHAVRSTLSEAQNTWT